MANEEVRNGQTLFDCFNEVDKYKCKTCPSFRTNFLARLRSHIRKGHGDENVDEYVYKCLRCLFLSNSKYVMGRHSLFSGCATNDEDERLRRFLCYRTKTEPNISLNDAPGTICKKTEINQFQCEQCASKFKTKKYLKQHLKNIHLKPEHIKCEECFLIFKQKSHLTSHIKYRHSKPEDIEWFQCEQCSYKCKDKGSLKCHFQARHVNTENINWNRCEQCLSKFKQRSYLLRHIRKVHGKPEDIQWFPCNKCPYNANKKENLKRHFQVRHANPEDIDWHQCEQCSSKFKQKYQLLRHKQNHIKPAIISAERNPNKNDA